MKLASIGYDRNFSYKRNGLLWKAGAAYSVGAWQLGLTVTTPLVGLSGKGTYQYEEFFSSIPGLTTKPERYSSSYQKDLVSHYKTPWSVGAGASRKIGRNKIYVSTEWFSAVSKYSVMQAADHITQSVAADTVRFHLTDQLKSVWNAGVGAEIYISERVSGFASFSTDFTAVTNDISRFVQRQDEAANSTWNTDFYHVGGGVMLKLKGADITLGATHTGASMLVPRAVNFPENSSQSIFSTTDKSNLQWDRWRFVFSFSLPFLKNYTDNLLDDKKKKG